MLDIDDEFRNLAAAMDEQKIDYALCGGLAMAVYQHPRMTIDIDLLIQPESFEGAVAIAKQQGYTIRGKETSFANGAVEIRRVSKIDTDAGDVLSLDLLLVTPPLLPMWESRVRAKWEGGTFSIVSREALIALKRLRSSGQDLDDIKALEGGVDDA